MNNKDLFFSDSDLDLKENLVVISNALTKVGLITGYTSFEDGTKVESVENRFVTFDSDIKHSGTTCTNQKVRLVLNINYFQFDPS